MNNTILVKVGYFKLSKLHEDREVYRYTVGLVWDFMHMKRKMVNLGWKDSFAKQEQMVI